MKHFIGCNFQCVSFIIYSCRLLPTSDRVHAFPVHVFGVGFGAGSAVDMSESVFEDSKEPGKLQINRINRQINRMDILPCRGVDRSVDWSPECLESRFRSRPRMQSATIQHTRFCRQLDASKKQFESGMRIEKGLRVRNRANPPSKNIRPVSTHGTLRARTRPCPRTNDCFRRSTECRRRRRGLATAPLGPPSNECAMCVRASGVC